MAVSMGATMAQPGSGKGPGAGTGPMGAGPTASAPGMGMGPGGGRGAARYGSDYTPGWTLMNQQERNEHRDRMRSMNTYEECKAYRTSTTSRWLREPRSVAVRRWHSRGAMLATE